MRRLVLIALIPGLILAGILLTGSGDAKRSYRFAAIFDTADNIEAGEQVKIAGAVVGTVQSVELAPGPKARIVMSIGPRFAPLRANATCTILPEGPISENFVECEPGSMSRPTLSRASNGIPTVPLDHTTIPASLQDFIDVFTVPTDERIQVLLNELGIATAGRGQTINDVLRRSNPALSQAQRVLSIVDAQRGELADGIAQTNTVLTQLAATRQGVRRFVDNAASLSRTTAAHSPQLDRSIKRLPALLSATRQGLSSINGVAVQSTPLLEDLRAGAPEFTDLTSTLRRFANAGAPALRSLASAAISGRSAVGAAEPVVRDLVATSRESVPFSADLDRLLLSTRNTGGLEGILQFFYSVAVYASAYDSVSHITVPFVTVLQQCLNESGAAGCSSTYYSPGHGTVPANDPACGPTNPEPWAPFTNCTGSLTDEAAAIRHHSRAAASARGSSGQPSSGRAAVSSTTTPTPTPTTTSTVPRTTLPISTLTVPSVTVPRVTTPPQSLSSLLNYLLTK